LRPPALLPGKEDRHQETAQQLQPRRDPQGRGGAPRRDNDTGNRRAEDRGRALHCSHESRDPLERDPRVGRHFGHEDALCRVGGAVSGTDEGEEDEEEREGEDVEPVEERDERHPGRHDQVGDHHDPAGPDAVDEGAGQRLRDDVGTHLRGDDDPGSNGTAGGGEYEPGDGDPGYAAARPGGTVGGEQGGQLAPSAHQCPSTRNAWIWMWKCCASSGASSASCSRYFWSTAKISSLNRRASAAVSRRPKSLKVLALRHSSGSDAMLSTARCICSA